MRRAALLLTLVLATAGCGTGSDSLGTTTPDDAGVADTRDAAIDDAAGGRYEDIDYSDTRWAIGNPRRVLDLRDPLVCFLHSSLPRESMRI